MRPQAFPGDRLPMPQQFSQRARGDHFAPVHTRPRAQIDDVIRPPHGRFVVFDHKHGVAARLELSSAASNCSLSRACRPMVGSSRM